VSDYTKYVKNAVHHTKRHWVAKLTFKNTDENTTAKLG